jgi:hypothetical protein
MKLASRVNKVRRGDQSGPETRFSIVATAKVFDTLSNTLYSEKVQAVVRELGTNAYDSHVDAERAGDVGKAAVPFVAHCPTVMEPYFAVQDFGTGMSDKQIRGSYLCPCGHDADADAAPENREDGKYLCPDCGEPTLAHKPGLYTTYFDSNRTHSDAYTGGFGLGSKSPFAYTDQFTVTSVHNGEKNIYTLFRDENNFPAINRLSSEKTDEPNGVEVRLPVNTEDFTEFRQKMGEVYRWFAVRPTITGIEDFKFPALKKKYHYQTSGSSYRSYHNSQQSWYDPEPVKDEAADTLLSSATWTLDANDPTTFVMGNVAYPVPAVEGKLKAALTKAEAEYIDYGFVAHVGVGELDMTPSRESLQITKTSLWDARIALGNLVRLGRLSKFMATSADEVTYKGQKFELTIKLPAEVKGEHCTLTFARSNSNGTFAHGSSGAVVPGVRVRVVINDLQVGVWSRVERALRCHQMASAYVLTPAEGFDIQKFVSDSGMEAVTILASKLQEPVKVVRPKSEHKTAKAVRLTGHFGYKEYVRAWTDATVDMDEGGIYVEVNRYQWTAGEKWKGLRDPHELRDILNAANLRASEIIGLRRELIARAEANPKWKRLDNYIRETLTASPALRELAAKVALWNRIDQPLRVEVRRPVKSRRRTTYQRPIENIKEIAPLAVKRYIGGSPFASLAVDMNVLLKASKNEEASNLLHVATHYRELIPKGYELPKLDALEKDLRRRITELGRQYPLLQVTGIQCGEYVDAMLEYVFAMDVTGKSKAKQKAA